MKNVNNGDTESNEQFQSDGDTSLPSRSAFAASAIIPTRQPSDTALVPSVEQTLTSNRGSSQAMDGSVATAERGPKEAMTKKQPPELAPSNINVILSEDRILSLTRQSVSSNGETGESHSLETNSPRQRQRRSAWRSTTEKSAEEKDAELARNIAGNKQQDSSAPNNLVAAINPNATPGAYNVLERASEPEVDSGNEEPSVVHASAVDKEALKEEIRQELRQEMMANTASARLVVPEGQDEHTAMKSETAPLQTSNKKWWFILGMFFIVVAGVVIVVAVLDNGGEGGRKKRQK